MDQETRHPVESNTPQSRPGRGLADMLAEGESTEPSQPFGWMVWVKLAVLGALFAKLNWWQFRTLVRKWLADDNWTHGFIIPLFSLFLIYNWRERLITAPRRVCRWGLAVIAIALLVIVAGVHPIHTNWISQVGIPILLFGLVLYLAGPRVAWVLVVPIFYLILAMPIPDGLYLKVAYPLQELAAKMSTGLLQLFGVKVTVTASRMDIVSLSGVSHPLTVAEACSGVRSLLAFVALGVALAYIEQRPFWQRAVMILAAVPITVICNILRVTITSTMFVIDKKELGVDFMHAATGMVLLVPALFLLFGLGKLMQRLYIEEEAPEEPLVAARPGQDHSKHSEAKDS